MSNQKKLRKSSDKKIAGVCGGFAEYLDMDPTVVRVIYVLLALFYGCGLIIYIICALVMPQAENKTPLGSAGDTGSSSN